MGHRSHKTFAAVAAASLLALPLSACSFPGGGAPEPVAAVPNVTGKTTAIKLDKGFVAALSTPRLTPGTIGRAKLTKQGALCLPDHRRQRHRLQAG